MAAPPGIGAPYPDRPYENRGPTMMVVASTMTSLGVLFTSARIYCRMISIKHLAVEDYIVIISAVSATAKVRLL
jgi:hypothetical protein